MAESDQQGVSLHQVLGFVEQALTTDRHLLVQLFRQFQRLASQPGIPAPEQRLGEVLSAILMGEREPDLDGLDPEAVAEIKEALDRLAQSG